MPTKEQLQKQVDDLEAENEDLQDRLDTIAELVGNGDDSDDSNEDYDSDEDSDYDDSDEDGD